MKNIWILAETEEGRAASSYYELLGKIKDLYAENGGGSSVTAVALTGQKYADSAARELMESGADEALIISDPLLMEYRPAAWSEALYQAAEHFKPDMILVPASETGSEVGPSVAAKLRTGLVAHCAELKADEDGTLHMLVPAFGGKLMADNTIPEARPLMVSVKPGVFSKKSVPKSENARREDFHPVNLSDGGIAFVKRDVKEHTDLSVTDADVVVCAGLGSAVSGNFEKVRKFADRLNAAFGYTRPVSDLGYMPDESAMIGTSGKTIKPKVYIGFGVSGAGQHVCGIKDSGVIISVNSDEEAQCFDVSDLKAVSDCGPVLDALLALTGK